MATLTVSRLSKSFGSYHALKKIDLDVDSGEFIVLVGPSGCGKSTLLNIIAGLEKHRDGDVLIGGRNVNLVPARDRDIAMVFQSYALYPSMTVRQNMLFGMKCRGVPRAEQEVALKRVAGLLQIEVLLERKPSQLSGGQRQRVAIGRALVRDPSLFLFDEPLSNLDAKLRVQMRMEIKQLHQKIGKTTVYVTHDQVEAMTLASRVAVMRDGEVQQFDRPEVVYGRPANLFVARFMGAPSMNTVDATVERLGDRIDAVIGKGGPDEVRLSLDMYADIVSRRVGSEIILGIRPEHIVHGSRVPDVDRRGGQVVEARVVMSELTGSETVVMLSAGGSTFLSRVEPDTVIRAGERVAFTFDTRKLCLFDPKTEKRLG